MNKPDSIFRIAVVGASNEVSMGQPLIHNYIYVCDSLFRHFNCKVEVINLSMDGGHRWYNSYKFILQNYKKYKPDLILYSTSSAFWNIYLCRDSYKGYRIAYDPNNLLTIRNNKRIVNDIHHNKCLTTIYNASYIVRYFCKKHLEKDLLQNPNTYFEKCVDTYFNNKTSCENNYYLPYSQFTNSKTTELINNLSDTLKKNGVKLVMYNFTNSHTEAQVLSTLFNKRKQNSLVIDLSTHQIEKLTYKHDGHINSRGNDIIAIELYESLRKSNLIPRKYLTK